MSRGTADGTNESANSDSGQEFGMQYHGLGNTIWCVSCCRHYVQLDFVSVISILDTNIYYVRDATRTKASYKPG